MMLISGTGSGPDHHYRIRFCTSGPVHHYRIRFCTSGPVPISMRYPGSAWTERSQIRPASEETDRDHVRNFYSGPDGHRSIRIGSVFVHLARYRYRCVIPDPPGLNEARSDPPPAKQIRTTSAISVPGRMVIARSESDPFLYIWPGFYMDALSTICLYRTKPDLTYVIRRDLPDDFSYVWSKAC